MKLFPNFITLALLLSASTSLFAQTFSESRSVKGHVTTDETAETISLHWNITAGTTSFKIYKRSLTSNNWGEAIATLAATDSTYTDTDVDKGTIYEYAIERITNVNDRFRSGDILGYSYLSASIEAPAKHQRGTIWVLATKLINDSLPNEISVLMNDLVADGWNVYTEVINGSARVTDVKDFIKSKQSSVGCDAVYLLGHVPVPYSGVYCEDDDYAYPPDGHNELDPNSHCGAWPADAFYADLTGNWTDEDSTSLALRPENDNAIGDGKYDQHRIPGEVTVAVGRVDLSDLPAFGLSEVALTKRYLDKVHQYKRGNTPVLNKALVENNFAGFDEGFSSAALRDFYAICGDNSIVEEDLFEASRQNDYLLSYVCGGGSYNSCLGFGTTDSLVTNNTAAFNHMFGSFFGDWDNSDNLMRATLATENLGFNVVWSGRPKWVTHTLAVGESYADITKRSQNNFTDYDGNFYQNGTHMALLGDPSLRVHAVQPAKNLALEANSDRSNTLVSWNATEESDILGYYVYRSHRKTGKFELITETPITATIYTDSMPYSGTNHYMVRVVKKQITGSGSYINLSLGINGEINEMEGKIASLPVVEQSSIKVYPTVASTTISIEQELPHKSSYQIYSTMGTLISIGNFSTKTASIDVSHLASGAYFVKTASGTARFIKR